MLENVKDGARETADLVDRYNAVAAEMAEPDADYEKLGDEMAELQTKIDAVDGWTLDNQLEIAMEGAALPALGRPGREPLWRREAPRRAHSAC